VARSYDALVLDIDGTLVDEQGCVHPRTLHALARVRAAGVVVMLATGRPHVMTRELMRELALDSPALVYNGAALYCPRENRLIEQRVLADELVAELQVLAAQRDLFFVIEHGDDRYARAARTDAERRVLAWLGALQPPPDVPLAPGLTTRLTFFSEHHADSLSLHDELRLVLSQPTYLTHYGLALLSGFRDSPIQGVDVHPVCEGTAEVFRVLQAHYGIAAERVVAVGDATNDLPMLAGAGLGVAMGNACDVTKRSARRVIGDHCSDALACLIEELFLT
jgi:hydroxymethylpyrimidine pyrophosphatase-like HAD family hydrolase